MKKSNFSRDRKHPGFIRILAIVFAVLVAGGALLFLATYKKDPYKVVEAMAKGLEDVKSVQIDGTIDIKYKPVESEGGGLIDNEGFEMISEFSPEDGLELKFTLQAVGIADESGKTGKSSGQIGIESDMLKGNLDFRYLDEKTYMKLNSFSLDGMDPFMDIGISGVVGQYIDKWIYAEKSEEDEDDGEDELSEEELKERFNNIMGAFNEEEPLTFVPIDGRDGEKAYEVKVDKEKMAKFLDRLIDMDYDKDDKKSKEEQKKEMRESVEKMQIELIEFAVQKRTELPARITMKLKNPEAGIEKFDIEFLFSNYNQEFVIDEPEGAQTFEELMEDFMGGMEMSPFMMGDEDFMDDSALPGFFDDDMDFEDFDFDDLDLDAYPPEVREMIEAELQG